MKDIPITSAHSLSEMRIKFELSLCTMYSFVPHVITVCDVGGFRDVMDSGSKPPFVSNIVTSSSVCIATLDTMGLSVGLYNPFSICIC